MSAIHRLDYVSGDLLCPCGLVEAFIYSGKTDMAELEDVVLSEAGWSETGLCPVCARERAQSEAADSAMRDRKAGMEG